MSRVRRKALVAVSAISVVAVLGTGFAMAATSGSTIKACAQKSDGALRLAKKCKSNEKAVSWGATGPRGATGATGPAGPAGPSDLYTFAAASTTGSTLMSGSNVVTFTLPAGNWLLHSDVRVGVTSAAESAVFCTFNINTSVKGTTFFTAVPKIGATATSGVLPVSGTVRLTQATPLNLFCRNTDGSASISPSPVTATRVGAITPEPAAQSFVTP